MSEQTAFWDDPSVRPAASSYAKFVEVGDSVEGTVAELGKRVFNPGTPDERTAIEIRFSEPEAPVLTAGQILLQQALFDFKPRPGDHLTVALTAIEKSGGKTLKKFAVAVRRPDGTADHIDQSA